MIIGNITQFAIESFVAQAYERLSFRALGHFVIHINGQKYGVDSPDATLLACSFDEVNNRLVRSGSHTAPFATESDANKIANAVCAAIYSEEMKDEDYLGMSHSELHNIIYTNKLIWAPDGDEAFDDGSHVLQFDVENQVRLIGFKREVSETHIVIHTLTDLWVDAAEFYDILLIWHDNFEAEWKLALKCDEA